jgi:hypothetical protein
MQHGFIYKEMKSRGKDWRYSSSDRVYALQVQSPELKTSSPQKKKKKEENKAERSREYIVCGKIHVVGSIINKNNDK